MYKIIERNDGNKLTYRYTKEQKEKSIKLLDKFGADFVILSSIGNITQIPVTLSDLSYRDAMHLLEGINTVKEHIIESKDFSEKFLAEDFSDYYLEGTILHPLIAYKEEVYIKDHSDFKISFFRSLRDFNKQKGLRVNFLVVHGVEDLKDDLKKERYLKEQARNYFISKNTFSPVSDIKTSFEETLLQLGLVDINLSVSDITSLKNDVSGFGRQIVKFDLGDLTSISYRKDLLTKADDESLGWASGKSRWPAFIGVARGQAKAKGLENFSEIGDIGYWFEKYNHNLNALTMGKKVLGFYACIQGKVFFYDLKQGETLIFNSNEVLKILINSGEGYKRFRPINIDRLVSIELTTLERYKVIFNLITSLMFISLIKTNLKYPALREFSEGEIENARSIFDNYYPADNELPYLLLNISEYLSYDRSSQNLHHLDKGMDPTVEEILGTFKHYISRAGPCLSLTSITCVAHTYEFIIKLYYPELDKNSLWLHATYLNNNLKNSLLAEELRRRRREKNNSGWPESIGKETTDNFS